MSTFQKFSISLHTTSLLKHSEQRLWKQNTKTCGEVAREERGDLKMTLTAKKSFGDPNPRKIRHFTLKSLNFTNQKETIVHFQKKLQNLALKIYPIQFFYTWCNKRSSKVHNNQDHIKGRVDSNSINLNLQEYKEKVMQVKYSRKKCQNASDWIFEKTQKLTEQIFCKMARKNSWYYAFAQEMIDQAADWVKD